MRVTLKTVNGELARLGYTARLAKAGGYFYFQFGEAADWLDRTVPGDTIGSRTLEEWIGEFHRLQNLNRDLLSGGADVRPAALRARRPRARKTVERR